MIDLINLCAGHDAPIVPFGVGSSLEGHVNAPHGGVSLDCSRMNKVLAVNAEDLHCVVEPGVTRKQLNDYLHDTGLFPYPSGFRRLPRAAWPQPGPRAPTPCATAR